MGSLRLDPGREAAHPVKVRHKLWQLITVEAGLTRLLAASSGVGNVTPREPA
ncbi:MULTISPECIES: hypothetical protein [unclassified Arthrobacter]|uniref:hypothetical protein n=1 Tax=unclassified Arthrobacter TaxID=235627 RepID=UPI003399B066